MSKAIVIDGNSLLYRVFWATYKMLDYYKKNNLPFTNALQLFTKAIFKLVTNEYDYVFVAFDHQKKSFRNTLLSEYKANRPHMPQELAIQIPMIYEMLEALGIFYMSKENFEADDLIGSFCFLMNQQKIPVSVYSSDKDMLQLVNQLTTVNLFKTGVSEIKKYDINNFESLFFGLNPNQVIDFKAIVGDSSDNFSGIKGIGPKTASMLIKKYGSFNNIYEHLSELTKKQQDCFFKDKVNGQLAYNLAIIKKDLFFDSDFAKFKKQSFNYSKFSTLIKKYQIPSLFKYLK